MEIFLTFLQIVAFPGFILFLAYISIRFTKKQNEHFKVLRQGTIFSIAAYIVNTLITFPLWFLFRPEEINGMFFLSGFNVYAFWFICIFIATPTVYGIFANQLYFKKMKPENYIKKGMFLGACVLFWGFFFEIIIYVYLRKTIPSIPYYFLGKNFPWIDINWIVAFITQIAVAYFLKKRNERKELHVPNAHL